MVVEGNTGLCVEDGRVVVSEQIGGDEVVLGVCENACGGQLLETSLRDRWLAYP